MSSEVLGTNQRHERTLGKLATMLPPILQEVGAQLSPEAKILDFGCGDGQFVELLRKEGFLNTLGADFKSELPPQPTHYVSQIRESPYRLPFPDEEFDLVVSFSVFEHVMDYELAIAEIFRVLKTGGSTLHIFPSRYSLFEPHVNVPLAPVLRPMKWLTFWA